jgi:hypothetical protein
MEGSGFGRAAGKSLARLTTRPPAKRQAEPALPPVASSAAIGAASPRYGNGAQPVIAATGTAKNGPGLQKFSPRFARTGDKLPDFS